MKTFGEKIRAAREKKELFLRQVAAVMDIDQAIISKFEKGDRKPSEEQVEKFAAFFEIDKDELIIAWKSDLVYNDLKDERLSNQILKVAEQKINYAKSKVSQKV